MRLAARLGIFAFGLIGLVGVAACVSSPYGEEPDSDPAPSSTETTKSSALPTPPKTTTHIGTTTSDAGAAPAKPANQPGSVSPTTTDAGTPTVTTSDAGACVANAPSAGGYVTNADRAREIGACNNSDIGYYEGLLAVPNQSYGQIQTVMQARNDICADCIFSKYADATWSPVIMLDATGGFFNWGACYANSPGGSQPCADQVQQWFDCLDDVCTDCVSDADFASCQAKASADPKSCGGLPFDACGSNLDNLNAACDTAAKAIGASCGPL